MRTDSGRPDGCLGDINDTGLLATPRGTGTGSPHVCQAGVGMMGFLLVLIPLLSIGVGGVELAHWMNLRQALSLALLDATRAGITQQASPQAIADAFESSLRMVYVRPEPQARALQQRRRALGAPWRIYIVQPNPAAFLDHADPNLAQTRSGERHTLIRNDYQAEQFAAQQALGWVDGRGPQSGQTIFEANTLTLELWWPQAPLVPGTQALIQALSALHQDPVGRAMMAQGYLPFRRRMRMSMQSHPRRWPDLADGRVIHAQAPVWPITQASKTVTQGGSQDPRMLGPKGNGTPPLHTGATPPGGSQAADPGAGLTPPDTTALATPQAPVDPNGSDWVPGEFCLL